MTDHKLTLEELALNLAEDENRPVVRVTNAELAEKSSRRFRVLQLRDSGEFGDEGDHVAWIDGQWLNLTTQASLGTAGIENTIEHETTQVSHTRYVGPDDPANDPAFDVQDGDEWVQVE